MKTFAFRLAGHLKMTVGELFNRMTSSEFAYWIAFYDLCPWEERSAADYRQAVTSCVIARSNGAKVEVSDFMPSKEKSGSIDENAQAFIAHMRSRGNG